MAGGLAFGDQPAMFTCDMDVTSKYQLIPYQACRSTEGWSPVKVVSSTGEATYTVLVSPWAVNESMCECKSYLYRGICKHQGIAAARVCGWTELSDPQQQNKQERTEKVCPKCGGPTRWEVEVHEE